MKGGLPKQFRKSEEATIKWLSMIQDRLGYEDTEAAFVAFRAVLHALRDRLTTEQGVDLVAQMPILIKGVFVDGWKPSKNPVKMRHKNEFLERVQQELRDTMDPGETVKGVFDVIKVLISEGEIADIKSELPEELQEFLQ